MANSEEVRAKKKFETMLDLLEYKIALLQTCIQNANSNDEVTRLSYDLSLCIDIKDDLKEAFKYAE